MKKFDLTTQAGVALAQNFLGTSLIGNGGPLFIVGKYLLDKLFTTPEEQGKVVQNLIEKGKKEGVDEMEIELKDRGGLAFNAPIEGCNIDVHVGKDQKMRIKVKYK
ncbi:MAG: hypothetical protein HDR83_02485 [Bacteroides sp.]|nr:hypothetical protein [Bacteroides sp.]